jgi:hypothetical protein
MTELNESEISKFLKFRILAKLITKNQGCKPFAFIEID